MKLKSVMKIFLLGVLGIVLAAFIFGVVSCVLTFPHESHSVWLYAKFKHDWPEELVGHFPALIPENAIKPKLAHFPGCLQGGSYFQIRYGLPDEEILALYDKFSRQKTISFVGGDRNDHFNMKNGAATTFFYTEDIKSGKFPPDYEILVFDPLRPSSSNWNHGTSHGVAISKEKKEIVYWAESW